MNKTKNLSLKQIIHIADKVYSEGLGLVKQAARGEECGDTLAEFIARELKDTYDPKATKKKQLSEAHRVMFLAKNDIEDVVQAFSDALYHGEDC